MATASKGNNLDGISIRPSMQFLLTRSDASRNIGCSLGLTYEYFQY